MIEFKNVSKIYTETTYAVRKLDLRVEDGEFLILVGESGCGKTTTLKMINRLIEKDEGELFINGVEVGNLQAIELRRKIGYVFQGIGLFPHMTINENIAIVPRLLGWEQNKIQSRCSELLELVGLNDQHVGDRYPRELSGGQQQRIGFARALASEPKIMLLDEPFGALDPLTRTVLQQELKVIHKKLNLTALMVTHDITEALLMADKIAVMANGKLLQVATPKELAQNPANDYIAQLLQNPKKQADLLEEVYAE